MKRIKGTLHFQEDAEHVVTLGKFDGLHRGHQALIERVMTYDRKRAKKAVFMFDIAPMMLLSKKERRLVLENAGIDLLIECPFVPELITMDPELFVRKMLVKQLHAVHLVVGKDFRFGYERSGDVELLKTLGPKYGFTVEVLDKVMDGDREISSTYIREELAKGNMEKVNELLGYEFFVTGEIVHGRRVGRTLGVPTTNLIPPKGKLLPPNGVYTTRTTAGDKTYYGMTNIGNKPTVDGHFIGVETYLFDCDEELYGEQEKVRLQHYLRPEVKFDSLEELKQQLQKDEVAVRAFFESE
ncbi:MAG: bifunctional riboflavin kinase/FAD synthetase [Lachnospiraceae bacterium]|nr:bifunctional riboflavin kinase/FAD synthetase [Lachnospiraceae bacterium]